MLTMTLAAKSLLSAVSFATRAGRLGLAVTVKLVRALNHRRAVLRLSELDERALKDIGLVRSDVEGALATSWLRDPSSVLAARSSLRSGVAAARRDEGLRQAVTQPAAARPALAAKPPADVPSQRLVACRA